jgi:hypothetical protein
VIFTLTFVAWLAFGGQYVGGGAFPTQAECQTQHDKLAAEIEANQLPDGAVAVSLGPCVSWVNPVGQKDASTP